MRFALQLKLLFMISVVRDRLLFMTEIPYMDDTVQKSLCGEQLLAEPDQRLPDFAHTGGLCKLPTTFCVNFEQQRCKISMFIVYLSETSKEPLIG